MTIGLMFLILASPIQAGALKPFILGNAPQGDIRSVITQTKNALAAQGFQYLGGYAPFKGAVVLCVTSTDIRSAAAKNRNGGFGLVERVSVTKVNGKIQVAYVNPTYMGIAYGMGKLESVSAKLKAALGARATFGSKGVDETKLAAGNYTYGMFMPHFYQLDILNTYPDYKTAVATIEKNLAAGKGGTKKVYRADMGGRQVSLFGVGIIEGDGIGKGRKDTDKEIMDIVDYKELKHTAYLPYEIMVDGNKAYALRARFRIAVFFPDTSMAGAHGFTKIMSAPRGIKKALEAVAGYR